MQEELLRRAEDLLRLAADKNRVCHSGFLGRSEAAFLGDALRRRTEGMRFSGGIPEAERTVFFALPEYLPPERFAPEETFAAVRIRPADGATYSHRDYLGSVMALGIERDTVGDILTFPGEAYLVTFLKAAEYLVTELSSVSGTRAKAERVELAAVPQREQLTETFEVSLTSLRADCAVAAVFRLSRGEAFSSIERGDFAVNGLTVQKPDKPVAGMDTLSLRGYGRVKLGGQTGVSRKGKLRLTCVREIR